MPEETNNYENENPHKQTSGRCKLVFVACLILLTAASLTVGLVLNKYLKKDDNPEVAIISIPDISVDCHPGTPANVTEESCTQKGCTWLGETDKSGRPKCVYPADYGYEYNAPGKAAETASGYQLRLVRKDAPHLLGMQPFQNLAVSVEYQTNQRLRIKIYPQNESVFEIPNEAINIISGQATNNDARYYDVTLVYEPVFGLMVKRRSSNVTIFDTTLPGLAMYPQFLQISARLNNSYLYGFGEHRHLSFRHDMNYRTWSMFTRDTGPVDDWNLYGAHPVYMNVENDGKANMVFLKNSHAMEVFLQPDPHPALTYRVIGGVLDFYIFLGDSPGEAVKLYTEAIGRPVLPPYWALGYQLSRWGYNNISDMQMVIDRNRAAGIPYDVQWADIDSLYKQYVFTYDREKWAGLPELVNDLHANHQHFVIITDPGVGANHTLIEEAKNNSGRGYNMFQDGEDAGIFVKASNGSTLIGEVWPGLTAYPDYTNVSMKPWYEKYVRFYRETEKIGVDSLWIDMNEPSSFRAGSIHGCEKTKWDYPPYVPNILGAEGDGRMYDKTICMSAMQAWGRHYDVHSLYAHAMAMRTNSVLKKIFPGKRPWTMTRSSFAGTGHYATKWMGDNQSKWPNMHWSIIGIMEFSMFGFAMNGADICGFWFETTYELCIRWHQLGAFYPFARNHNGRGDPPEIFKHQDPASFDQAFMDIIKQPLMTRYKLLPYLYTQLFRANLYGDTVLRPLMFEFPQDLTAREIDRQFLLGPALLISPVLEPQSTIVEAYFPQDHDARWYEYSSGALVATDSDKKGHVTLHTPLNKFNLHVRGGHVIPWQAPALTTFESRKNSMGLIVALDDFGVAQGDLYWDDGESEVNDTSYSLVKFTMKKAGELLLTPVKTDFTPTQPLFFTEVDVYGLTHLPSDVRVDGVDLAQDKVRWDNKLVQIFGLNLTMLEPHNVTWSLY